MPIGWIVLIIVISGLMALGIWVYRKPRCCGMEMIVESFKDGVRTFVCHFCGHRVTRLEPTPDDNYNILNRFPF